MRRRAAEFGVRVEQAKASEAPPPWGWYPYRMLPAFIEQLDDLLTGENRRLLEEPQARRIADLASSDGDLGFFLHSIGFEVDVIDGGENAAESARRLKRLLGSDASVYRVDIDHDFTLPATYDLVLCLGVFYHLRNPMLALDTLARVTRHCIISTKVMRYVARRSMFGRRPRMDVSEVPVAYLLDTYEVAPDDPTNYWVYSEALWRRMVARSGWTVLDYRAVGNVGRSLPAGVPEERAWCLLRSEVFGT